MANSLSVSSDKCLTKPLHQDEIDGDRCSSFLRVLVVDDYGPFRRFACAMLERMPILQIVGEAVDGLEAVRKALELRPDLILMDVGLPRLNGIEATRQIRKLVAESQIIFLSLETSPDVVEEAMKLGALSYIAKEHIGSKLMPVVEAVILDKQLVGTRV